jgi:hypothetical protein
MTIFFKKKHATGINNGDLETFLRKHGLQIIETSPGILELRGIDEENYY